MRNTLVIFYEWNLNEKTTFNDNSFLPIRTRKGIRGQMINELFSIRHSPPQDMSLRRREPFQTSGSENQPSRLVLGGPDADRNFLQPQVMKKGVTFSRVDRMRKAPTRSTDSSSIWNTFYFDLLPKRCVQHFAVAYWQNLRKMLSQMDTRLQI